jgi:hypothetical protein
MYAAMTKDKGNAADGYFSAAFYRLPLGSPRRNETDSFDEIQTAQKVSQELRSPLAGSKKIQ